MYEVCNYFCDDYTSGGTYEASNDKLMILIKEWVPYNKILTNYIGITGMIRDPSTKYDCKKFVIIFAITIPGGGTHEALNNQPEILIKVGVL